MMTSFRKDPFYLTKYHARWALGLMIVNALLGAVFAPNWETLAWFGPSLLLLSSPRIEAVLASVAAALAAAVWLGGVQPVDLLGVGLAFVLALSFSGLIHCASHGSLRPRFLNRPVGELMGLFQLSGFADWKIIHVFHHAHTDDPLLDPHPPGKKGFWEFTRTMRTSIGQAYLRSYFGIFGQTPQTQKAVKGFMLMSRLVVLNKIIFWYLILGPRVFAFVYTSSIAFKMLQFSLLNWAAHRPSSSGFEIRNLDQGFFKLMNLFSFGLYVHKNHHLVPTLFNPKRLAHAGADQRPSEEAA